MKTKKWMVAIVTVFVILLGYQNCGRSTSSDVRPSEIKSDLASISTSSPYMGCFTDGCTDTSCTTHSANSNHYSNEQMTSGATVETCVAKAKSLGYAYAGLESGGECFVGNSVATTPLIYSVTNSDCNTPCTSNTSEYCGGNWFMSIYSTAPPPLTVLTTTLNITSADNGKTFTHYKISTTSGPCVSVKGANNITISDMQIGPCGSVAGAGTTSDSNGIEIINSSSINVFDSYIHVETLAENTNADGGHASLSHIGVLGEGSTNLNIQGNVICYGGANIRATMNGTTASTGWTVNGNYLCNPRGYDGTGNNFQAADSWNMTVENNYAFSCIIGATGTSIMCPSSPAYLYSENQEDSFNFFYHNPQPSGVWNKATGNYVVGGHSISGTGIEGDQYSSGLTVENNTTINTGLAGISFSDGSNNNMSNNKSWQGNPISPNNTGMRIHLDNSTHTCGGDTLVNNIAKQMNGTNGSDIWVGTPACVSTNSGNVTGTAAETALGLSGTETWATIKTKLPPPLIPPVPKHCVVNSPYTTQTSLPRCP
jgi:hypothetical protein